jgi:hypothetical protein
LASYVTHVHLVLLVSLALSASMTVFATYQLRRVVPLTWWQDSAFLINIFCKVVIGVVPVMLVLADENIRANKYVAVVALPAFAVQMLLFLLLGRQFRLGIRIVVALLNLAISAACLYLFFDSFFGKFDAPSAGVDALFVSKYQKQSMSLMQSLHGSGASLCSVGNFSVLESTAVLATKMASNATSPISYSCFFSLHVHYWGLVRVMYVVLFFSLEFIPLILFVYPFRHYKPLERALGIDMDRITCFIFPPIAFFMLLFVITIEFQMS